MQSTRFRATYASIGTRAPCLRSLRRSLPAARALRISRHRFSQPPGAPRNGSPCRRRRTHAGSPQVPAAAAVLVASAASVAFLHCRHPVAAGVQAASDPTDSHRARGVALLRPMALFAGRLPQRIQDLRAAGAKKAAARRPPCKRATRRKFLDTEFPLDKGYGPQKARSCAASTPSQNWRLMKAG